jgi:superfamily II DNA helicase RecQ
MRHIAFQNGATISDREYRKIKGMLNEIEDNIPIVALTATATPKSAV